ncbi:MAG: ATP-binding domain-containing protein, partial [Spirochaetaceae bacterium]|nr:ATP-binding domain-containing protein [Spirochaetaceae bacterium]
PGKKPVLAFLPDQDAEAAFCAELIENSLGGKEGPDRGKPALYSDWAILYRTNAQSLGFETEFLRRRIPYRVVGSLKFYEREEIKDALALLSFLANPRDEVAFRRVVNKPARGAGAATVDRVVEAASLGPQAGGDLAAAARRIMPSLTQKARGGLGVFLAVIERGRSILETENKDRPPRETGKAGPKRETGLQGGEGLSVCVARLVEDAGIAEYHLTHDDIAGNQRISNLQELVNAASLYDSSREGLLEFLEHIELDRSMEDASGENPASLDAVTLITLHNTKGLEFKRVVMTGIEQGLFPREDKTGEDLEEERRLFYVGATRAMDELYLTSCAMRRMFGRTVPMDPSRFLAEADPSSLRIIGKAPHGVPGPVPGGRFRGRSGPYQESRPAGKGGTKVWSSDGRWYTGCRIFHDDHGYGAVADIRESDEGPVIRVCFETGKELRFLSRHQSSRFVKIGGDD